MKTRRIILMLLVLALGLILTACKPEDVGGEKGRLYSDDEIPTPNTDALVLSADYEGKDFIEDGIGRVTLLQHIDNNTSIFRTLKGETITVRYLGIDTPESTYKVEPWGFAASDFTNKTLGGIGTTEKVIVLEADSDKNRIDSTGKRWLAWVWVDGRLLNMEIIEKCYSASKASNTKYAEEMLQASIDAQAFGTRIWDRALQDPQHDYSKIGIYMSLRELHEKYNNSSAINAKLDQGKVVRIQGIVTKRTGVSSAYITQQVEGYWYIGATKTTVVATESDSPMPFVGENGNWFVGEIDLGFAANGQVGQTSYEVYVDNLPAGETPKTEYAWARSITVTEPDASIATPYIVQPDIWYGMYIYGGYQDITNFVAGREIYSTAKIGYFGDNVQLTDVSNKSVQVSGLDCDFKIITVSGNDFNRGNRTLTGSLVEISNLIVVYGYDSEGGGFTVQTQQNGKRVDLRIQKDVYIYLDENRTKWAKSWEEFKDIKFIKVVGVMDYYNDYPQILVVDTEDLTY